MKFTLKKKIVAGALAGATLIGGSMAAYAYITGGSGSGTGTAGVVSSVTENDLSAVATATGLVPGAASGTATSVKVTNSHAYSVQFGRISVGLDSTEADWPGNGCTYALASANNWFTIGSDATGAFTAVAKGDSTFTGPTILMNDDSGHDQTGCLGQSIPLTVTLSAS